LQLVVVSQVNEAKAALSEQLLDPKASDVLRLLGGDPVYLYWLPPR
jgi:hypothetical protein